MLNLLERFDLRAMGHNSIDYIRTIAEVQKYATVDKDKFLGDPAFVDIPLGRFLDREVVQARYAEIRAGGKVNVHKNKAGQTQNGREAGRERGGKYGEKQGEAG